MKKFILVLAALLTNVTVFAGDKYFICSHVIDGDSQEEQFVADVSIDEELKETVGAIFQISSQPQLLYFVEYNPKNREFKASVKNIRAPSVQDTLVATLEYNNPIYLTQRLSCAIVD